LIEREFREIWFATQTSLRVNDMGEFGLQHRLVCIAD
jgi:hypothetical protein